MPARVAKLNSKPEILRQLNEEFAQRVFAVGCRERRRELNENHLELRPE